MDGLQFDEMLEMDIPKVRTARTKPVKRKWREIEAIKDRQRLQQELMDMDIGLIELEEVKF